VKNSEGPTWGLRM